jgi:hypothetical protein
MSTPTATSGSSLAMLTEAWRAFLKNCPLPEPALVSLDPATYRISIQAGGIRDSLDHLGELLLWSYTLEQVSAQWWHTSHGDLHITVQGRTSIGVAFKIYGGIPLEDCAGLVLLAPEESEDVSLDELYTLLGLLREHHQALTAEVSP